MTAAKQGMELGTAFCPPFTAIVDKIAMQVSHKCICTKKLQLHMSVANEVAA